MARDKGPRIGDLAPDCVATSLADLRARTDRLAPATPGACDRGVA